MSTNSVDDLIRHSVKSLEPPSIPEVSRTYAMLALAKAIDNCAQAVRERGVEK